MMAKFAALWALILIVGAVVAYWPEFKQPAMLSLAFRRVGEMSVTLRGSMVSFAAATTQAIQAFQEFEEAFLKANVYAQADSAAAEELRRPIWETSAIDVKSPAENLYRAHVLNEWAQEQPKITCPCCGASPYYVSRENPYCDDCNTDTCGHWIPEERGGAPYA